MGIWRTICSRTVRGACATVTIPFMNIDESAVWQISDEGGNEVRGAAGEGGERTGTNDGASGWTTTKQAAQALGVSRRMVQEYVRRGELEAVAEGEGVSKRYYVSIASLDALRERRGLGAKDESRYGGASPEPSDGTRYGEGPREGVGEVLRWTIQRLEARANEASELRARLEMSVQGERALKEALERERERVDLERGRADRLEAELKEFREMLREAPEPPAVEVEDEGEAGAPRETQEEPVPRRSWPYRFFFGP